MSYNIGLMLSLVYMISILLLGGDVYCLTSIRNNLDAIALTVSYRISLEGRLSDSTVSLVESEGAFIRDLTHYTPPIGGTLIFEVYKEYEPLVIGKSAMEIVVRRTAVVGFYQTMEGGETYV